MIAQEFELEDFPFDVQPLTILVTLNIPTNRAVIIGNEEYPSLFLHKTFQQKSVYNVVYKEQLHWELQQSDASESTAGWTYPRIMFSVSMQRRYGYYITNVVLPIGVLTAMTAVTCGTKEPDGSPMGTASRLGLTFTLILTAVAYKLVVSASLPAISYQTVLDVYVLICFLWMLLAALENALFSHLAYAKDDDAGELVVLFNELWVMLIYLVSFAITNVVFWWRVSVRVRRHLAEARSRSVLDYTILE